MKTQRIEWMTITRWLLLAGLVPALLHAQDTAAASAADGAGDVSLGQLWAQGGWAMYPLALFSMAAFGLIVFNAMAIREKALLRPDVTAQLAETLGRGDVASARTMCEEEPCLVANITAAGLARVKAGAYDVEAVEKAMEEAAVEEIAGPFGVISYLSILATLAPMVGMLGTVSGMIKAFRNIALGGMGKPELLADNISEALITTAVGLVVGIPAMFAFFFFKSRYARLTSRLARICGDLHHTLTHAMRTKGGGA
ncbi:MotA/TolQ/ExbB proton channel family protein [Actomonas aquatica]|uniref:MotA/TolQ/ExbB proton channel family protein n=1 Tax=Actomonas aquatica TaxID=2866162 RepID=A0ABZ1C5F1_9BACT|nr:MotA/TolQ/ExbB proton channel family protein [Opitutus sp. WL0086]WRQ86585.1 MotA/TolQ/ExbB proton channel family protein [Opitutus sp. WL0086]